MIGLLATPLARRLLPYAAVVGVLAATWLGGVMWKADRQALQELKEEVRTNDQINDADTGDGDPDADLEWLRRRGQSGGPL